MQFIWPAMLVSLLVVPALVAAYLILQRRRRRYAVRYASLSLVRDALGRGPGRRRDRAPAAAARDGDRARHPRVARRDLHRGGGAAEREIPEPGGLGGAAEPAVHAPEAPRLRAGDDPPHDRRPEQPVPAAACDRRR